MDRQFGERFDPLGLESAFAPDPESEIDRFGGEPLSFDEAEFFADPHPRRGAPLEEDLAWLGEVLEAEDEAHEASPAQWLEAEWLDTSGETAGGGETVEAFAERVGREWSQRLNGEPSAEAKRAALIADYADTMAGARWRYGKKNAAFYARVTRGWMISREEQMRFETERSTGIAPLGPFAPPADRPQLVDDALVGGTRDTVVKGRPVPGAKITPFTLRFARALRRRHRSVGMTNYHNHGGGAFNNRGLSLDLWLGKTDERGFYLHDDALRLFRAVDAAARDVGARWRALYNDFTAADAINRELGRRHVLFMGTVRRNKAKKVVGLNWHGPDPLILHVHLDITPRSGGAGEAEAFAEEDYVYAEDRESTGGDCGCRKAGSAREAVYEDGESWPGEALDPFGESEADEAGRYDLEDGEGFADEWLEHEGPQAFDGFDTEASSLAAAGLTPAELRAVEITSSLETGRRGGFHGLTGNGDNQGLSFGLVNWTIGTGSLQPLLRAYATGHPARWDAVFGADAARFREVITPRGKAAVARQLRFAREEMNATSVNARGKTVWYIRKPWSDYFKALGDDPVFRAIQIRFVRPIFDKAEAYCRKFGLTSERAFTFMFDAVSSHGGAWLDKVLGGTSRRVRLERKLADQGKTLATVGEGDLLLAIAEVLGATSKPEYAAKVRRRKRWFVLPDDELERIRGLAGLRPSASTPFARSRPPASRESGEDLAWLSFEDEDEWTGEEESGWSGEQEQPQESWEALGFDGEQPFEREWRPSLSFEEALLEASGIGSQFGWEGEDEAACKTHVPKDCVDYPEDYRKKIRPSKNRKGELMDRTQGDRRVNLALQFRDYDVNAYLAGTKEMHSRGIEQIVNFIQARSAVTDDIRVSITGSASKTGTQCFNQELSERRAECLAARIKADIHSAARAKAVFDVKGDGFTKSECEGRECELPGFRSVLVSVHGPDKPGPVPPEPPGWDKYCIRVCSFNSVGIVEAAIDELLKKLPDGFPEGLARGLIGKLRERLTKQFRKLLRKLPKLGALVGDVSKLLRFLPIEITRQTAVFQIKERDRANPRLITLCYSGFGFRLALPIPGDIDDALDEMLKKVPGVGSNDTMRKALREVIKRELMELLPGRVGKLLSKLAATTPGPWKAFDLNRRAAIEVFRGAADIFVDVISDVMDPGSIFLGFDGPPWQVGAPGRLSMRCPSGCAGSVIQVTVDGGVGFDLLSVNKGKLEDSGCLCPGNSDKEAEEAAQLAEFLEPA